MSQQEKPLPTPLALALATTRLSKIDLTIVALYLIGITLFGLRFREKKGAAKSDRSLKSYFLANNTIPWWAIALSIVSAETSTLTIISIPGVAFAGNFGFLQIVLGYMLGRIVVALLFLPRYFAGEMLTAYQLIDQRFGPVLHKVTAGLFLLTRAAAEGVRVFAVSIVVGIAIGTGDTLSIGIISLLTLLYTFEGGMAAVIWTDVVQMAIYIGGTFVAIWSLGHHIGADRSAIAGWSHIIAVAAPAHKFHMLNFAMNLTTTYTFWAGILGGTFLTMASHGTDQLMVQRMLAARSLRESRLALLSSGVVIFMQFALFLLIGVGLYVFYGTFSGGPSIAPLSGAMGGGQHSLPAALSPDRIFPTFIVHELPLGIAGLLVAAILAAAMSNLSAALNSLSSTTVVDFYMRLRPKALLPENARERDLISKSSTVLWALVLFAIAIYSLSVGGKGHVVEIGLSIASVAYGCLLGVFLLGTLTKFATEIGATAGMICGFALNLWLWQGNFPVRLGVQTGAGNTTLFGYPIHATAGFIGITIPHIAFTWYVILGALVTFAIGTLTSLIFRKQSRRTVAATTAASLLLLFFLPFRGAAEEPASRTRSVRPFLQAAAKTPPDFSSISQLLNDAIANHHLPGAVVVVGHNNHIVFEQAYGNRKLAGEPGLNDQPSPAEPMTEDTIFDMASLTKCLATATAVMQLYDTGKITSFDDPISKYLPEFLASSPTTANSATAPQGQRPDSYQPGAKPQVSVQNELQRAEGPTHNSIPPDPRRALVTIRMLLTHTSGEAPDVDLRDAWGLTTPDRQEGLHRALTTPLKATPGTTFTYSDINFILLGDLVETLSGQREDDYARDHIFLPLGMLNTRYHPYDRTCGPMQHIGANTISTYNPRMGHILYKCPANTWNPNNDTTAPTAHDNEGTAATNPDFDRLLRGTVHDPTTRRMGGVAGHAGVFSTAHDISLYAQALLDKLLHNTGPFPVTQSTLQLMTQPEQPGHSLAQLTAANAATQAAPTQELSSRPERSAVERPAGGPAPLPGLAPHYPAIKDQNLRGFGWDIDTAFSKPRGAIFPIGSFGHTGFTGTSLWMDPASNTYVILLTNAIHPRGNPPISNLRGQIATAAAQALGLACTSTNPCHPERSAAQPKDPETASSTSAASTISTSCPKSTADCPGVVVTAGDNFVQPQPASINVSIPTAHLQRVATTGYPEASASGLISGNRTGLQPPGYAFSFSTTTLTGTNNSVQQETTPNPLVRRLDPNNHQDGFHSANLQTRSHIIFTPTLTGIDVLESTHFAPLTAALTQNCPNSKLETQQNPSPCHHRLGLLTNQTGLDKYGHRTIDILHSLLLTPYSLLTVFTPEHGINGTLDREGIPSTTDPATHLPVISLYGNKPADRHPTHDQLKDLDAVLIDLQDAGVHFWTYEAAAGYFLEAAALEKSQYHHDLQIIVLDRPNPIGGVAIEGPISDPGTESYVNYMPLPIRHGLTLGELLQYANAEKTLPYTAPPLPVGPTGIRARHTPPLMVGQDGIARHPDGTPTHGIGANLTVIPTQHWQRTQLYADTGLPAPGGKLNLSPNLRSLEAVSRYPALGLIETTNLSVGRGTDHPFSFFGAGTQSPGGPSTRSSLRVGGEPQSSTGQPTTLKGTGFSPSMPNKEKQGASAPEGAWFHATEVAAALTARHIPGVTFTATTETIAEDANHYPYHGQTIEAVKLTLTDPTLADTPEIGIEILAVLHRLSPTQFQLAKVKTLLCNQSTLDALQRGDDPRTIAATWQPALAAFRAATKPYLLY